MCSPCQRQGPRAVEYLGHSSHRELNQAKEEGEKSVFTPYGTWLKHVTVNVHMHASVCVWGEG